MWNRNWVVKYCELNLNFKFMFNLKYYFNITVPYIYGTINKW